MDQRPTLTGTEVINKQGGQLKIDCGCVGLNPLFLISLVFSHQRSQLRYVAVEFLWRERSFFANENYRVDAV